jgi:hypothetical protein
VSSTNIISHFYLSKIKLIENGGLWIRSALRASLGWGMELIVDDGYAQLYELRLDGGWN